jgi:hypothetical protein
MNRYIFPLLYQVNTRVWLTELSELAGRKATLDDIPDSELDRFVASGFDWIWFLSVWQTGEVGEKISRSTSGWRKEFEETLPDLKEEDIAGSGFAIKSYRVSEKLGGDDALARLRKRMNERGLKLMLDFVPNHTAIDNEWVQLHPGFFIRGTESEIAKAPQNYTRVKYDQSEIILAHGRDPFYPGWPDTLQLNYGNPDLQEAMAGELMRIAGQCDGVRCDMAMLLLPEIFEKTWGMKCRPFWQDAIKRVREKFPDFSLMAEVYWDMEWTMIQQGFNYAYDKRLYDRLKEGQPKHIREHFCASVDYQSKMARFLENHDEPRAAADYPPGKHEAAAVLTFLSPCLRFFQQGQFEGRKKKISAHLVRATRETVNDGLLAFYTKLLEILHKPVFRNGSWQLLPCMQAWEGNWTHDRYITFAWQGAEDEKYVVTVNYSPGRSQCYIKLPFTDLGDSSWILNDQIAGNSYKREGNDLRTRGLYLDEPGWKIYVFALLRSKV